jgi:hypothetical protein
VMNSLSPFFQWIYRLVLPGRSAFKQFNFCFRLTLKKAVFTFWSGNFFKRHSTAES